MDLQITATYPLFSRYQCMKYQSSTVFSWMVYMWYMYWQYAKCTVFSNPWNHGWTLNFNYWVLNLLYICIILHEGNLILTVYYFENNNKTLISCFEPLNHIKFQVSFFFSITMLAVCPSAILLITFLFHIFDIKNHPANFNKACHKFPWNQGAKSSKTFTYYLSTLKDMICFRSFP